ncbi:hypothetical protein [Pseudarthrobacter sp. TAF60_1]
MPTDNDEAVQTMELIDHCYTAIGPEPRRHRNEADTTNPKRTL